MKLFPKSLLALSLGLGLLSGAAEPDLYDLLSPIKRIQSDGAPVLILHGTKDTTVPIGYMETLVKALKEKNARHTYHVVEEAPHTFYIDSKFGDFREMIVNFFRENLR